MESHSCHRLWVGIGLPALDLFPADHPINTWKITLLDLGAIQPDLTVRINMQFIVGTIIMVAVSECPAHWRPKNCTSRYAAHNRRSSSPRAGHYRSVFYWCDRSKELLSIRSSQRLMEPRGLAASHWWTLLAAWSTYAAETAVCYMSEFRDPGIDAPKAIIWSGILCIALYVLVPFVFQGVLGTEYMMKPGIVSGEEVGIALAEMVKAGPLVTKLIVAFLTFTLVLGILTAMAGSSRTLYEGGRDGWMPKYLNHLNKHGIPTYAMWTDLAFNALLLLMSNYLFVLAVSCVNYVLFHYLNLNAGWIHRIDNPRVKRPYRTPAPLFIIGFCLAFFNAFLIGAGANVWGPGILWLGLASAFISVPIFWYRHYIVDKGHFPKDMLSDLFPEGETNVGPTRAGILPYLALAGGVAACAAGYIIFWSGLFGLQ